MKTDTCATLAQHFSILIPGQVGIVSIINTAVQVKTGTSQARRVRVCADMQNINKAEILFRRVAAEQAPTGAREERNNEGNVPH